jgi:hypothetical protein
MPRLVYPDFAKLIFFLKRLMKKEKKKKKNWGGRTAKNLGNGFTNISKIK